MLTTFTSLPKRRIIIPFIFAASILLGSGIVQAVRADTSEFESLLQSTPYAIQDPALINYLKSVVCRLAPEDCQKIRIYVSMHPAFHAEMHADGLLHIWSGTFLRIVNEHELAALLAHEVAHFLLKHTHLESPKQAAWYDLFTGGLGLAWQEAGELKINRNRERAADQESITLLHRAGYELSSASTFWHRLKNEGEYTARGHRTGLAIRSHPKLSKRIQAMRQDILDLSHIDNKTYIVDLYWQHIRPHYMSIMDRLVLLNESERLAFLLNIHKQAGFDLGLTSYYQGEYHRRIKTDCLEAITAYERAVENQGPPQAHRALSICLIKEKRQKTNIRHHIQRYLQINPDAVDKKLLRQYLQ